MLVIIRKHIFINIFYSINLLKLIIIIKYYLYFLIKKSYNMEKSHL